VNGEELDNVDKARNSGNTLSHDVDINDEGKCRIGKANSAFERPQTNTGRLFQI